MNVLPVTVAVADCHDQYALESASALAERLGLPMLPDAASSADYCRFLLLHQQGKLSLRHTAADAPGAICVDFDNDALVYRQSRSMQPEALLKASGVKQGKGQQVLDATAGLGQDAFIFASAGCEVLLVERSPILHALLEDGLRRARSSPNASVVASAARMTLAHADSVTFSPDGMARRPEIIYLDPMFPERRKSARVKKNMFLLQQLLEEDIPSSELLRWALLMAERRVVVKRPRLADFLEGRKPSHQLIGKASRFDVYVPSASGA